MNVLTATALIVTCLVLFVASLVALRFSFANMRRAAEREQRAMNAAVSAAFPDTLADASDGSRYDEVLDQVLREFPQVPVQVRADIRGRVFQCLAGNAAGGHR